MTSTVYKKDNSFVGLSGVDKSVAEILTRVKNLTETLDSLPADDHERSILRRACDSLLDTEGSHEDGFWLRPHIVAEISRVDQDRLADYLFYRFRYDVFPAKYELDGYPPCVQIEPTSVCNYRCVFCYQIDPKFHDRSAGHKGRMSLEMFKRVVDQLEGNLQAVTLASRGEPLLCRDIVPMLEYLSGKFLGLKINTNAWYLNEENAHALLSAGANTIVFSADAADDDLYAKLRVNGRLDKVLENIRLFSDIQAKHYPDSKTITRVSGVKFSEQQNFAEIEAFWRDFVDQVAFVEYNPWVSIYDAEDSGIDKPCSDLWRRTFVWWDGRINPCDVDYLSTLAAGHIDSETVSDVWTGDAYQALRKQHLNDQRGGVTPCRKCSLV